MYQGTAEERRAQARRELRIIARFAVGIVAVLALIALFEWAMPVVVWGCTIVGFLASGYFLVTWGTSIVKAKYVRHVPISYLSIIDFSALPLLVFLYTTLALVDLGNHGVPETYDWNSLIRRTILYILVALIAVLRAVRWFLYQRRFPSHPQAFRA